MEMLIPGLCGLVVIVGLVCVVMSRATWSIPQMVLVGFVLLGSLIFFYFSARTFVLAKNWNDELKKYVTTIDQVENGKSQGNQIVDKGIEQLKQDRIRSKHDIEVALAGRGRVWGLPDPTGATSHDVTIVHVNPDTREITATVDDPTPHGIEPKTTLFVFEQADIGIDANGQPKGGRYLGEFTVTSAKDGDKTIKMLPSLTLSTGELTAISSARGRLDLYEIMPADSHSLFAELDNRDELIKASFPKDVQSEYMREAQLRSRPGPAGPVSELVFAPFKEGDPPDSLYLWVKFTKAWTSDKPAAQVVAAPAAPAAAPPVAAPAAGAAPASTAHTFKPGDIALFDHATAAKDLFANMIAVPETNREDKGRVYIRPLRDYAQLFREAIRRRTVLSDETAEVTDQVKRVKAAQLEITADVEAIEKERAGLKSDLAKFQAEQKIVVDFVAAVEKRNEQLRADLSQTFRANIRMASELDQLTRQLQQEIIRRNPPVQSQASLAAPTP